jgi:molybdenum cofactor cytidylyltransferase
VIAAIVLAAGASRRMGRVKALLPWDGSTLLQHELATLREAGVERAVAVVGASADVIRRAVGPDAPLVFNARWGSGRATSLARGARALLAGAPPEAVLVQNVDQPTHVEVIARLEAELRASGADAVQPVYLDAAGVEHGGHPVLLAGALLPALAAAREETEGLRGVLAGRRVVRVLIDDATVGLDLDTPEAYEAARATLGA